MIDFIDENNHCQEPLRIQKKDNLSCRRSHYFSIILLVSLIKLAMVISSCENRVQEETPEPPPIVKEDDKRDYYLYFNIEDARIQKVDIMIYSVNGLRELEAHITDTQILDTYKFRLTKGDKIVAVIANYPQELKQAQILKYDTCMNLKSSFDDNQESYPIMVGMFQGDSGLIVDSLKVLISKIVLTSITNNLNDYDLVEKLRVRLCDLNSSIRCFDNKFFTTDYIDYGVWKNYTYDIGLEPQYPNIELYCYPNMDEAFCTRLELEYVILNKLQRISVDLPTIDLSSEINIELIINDIDDYDVIFNEE